MVGPPGREPDGIRKEHLSRSGSLFSGGWRLQVLYAIGVAMICMAFLRRLSSTVLLVLCLGWFFAGEWITGFFWNPADTTPSIVSALLVSSYSSPDLIIKYPLIPWLTMMALGWVFGRYLNTYRAGRARLDLDPVAAYQQVPTITDFHWSGAWPDRMAAGHNDHV